jgi:hypothetical protein
MNLINADPRYKHLSTEELADQLIEQANKVIDQGIRLLESGSLQIVIEEK